MMTTITFFNQVTAIGKRLAMVLTMLLIVGIGQAWGETTTYAFTSAKWADSNNGWTSGKDGAGYSNSGVQVTKNGTGANATSKTSFTNISSISVNYCTNKSDGAGTIVLTVGSTSKTLTVSKSGGTTMRTLSASFDPNVSGQVKITVNCTTNSIYIGGVTITTEEAASCDKEVKVVKGTPSNGSFNISKNGTYETCDEALVITLSNITPSDGYQFKEITQSGINTGVTIDQANKKVTYAQNTSGTSTINVTFTALETHSVTWMVNGSEYTTGSPTTQVYEGGQVTTLPTAPDPANYCGQVFAGWTTSPIDGETDTKPSGLFTTAANSPVITRDITFYAVFADYANQ